MKKNYVGISFEFAHEYTNHLGILFKDIPVETYTWYSLYSENYISGTQGLEFFMPNGVYNGEEFRKMIDEKEYYIHLLCLYGVPNGKSFDAKQIKDYEDYLNSNAEIALLSGDSITHLYCKSNSMLEVIATACDKSDETIVDKSNYPVRLFTEQDDERTGFLV